MIYPSRHGITRQATGRLGRLASATRLRYAVSEIQEVRQARRLPHQFRLGYIGGSVVFADRARYDRFGEETRWGVFRGGRRPGDQHSCQPTCATGASEDAGEKALCDG